jgi:hypothetical protein
LTRADATSASCPALGRGGGYIVRQVIGVDVDADWVGAREVCAVEELRGGLAGGEVLGLKMG